MWRIIATDIWNHTIASETESLKYTMVKHILVNFLIERDIVTWNWGLQESSCCTKVTARVGLELIMKVGVTIHYSFIKNYRNIQRMMACQFTSRKIILAKKPVNHTKNNNIM